MDDDLHSSMTVRHVNGPESGRSPVVAVGVCVCGVSATVHEDAHVMMWWRAHREEPDVSAAEFATRWGISVPTPTGG